MAIKTKKRTSSTKRKSSLKNKSFKRKYMTVSSIKKYNVYRADPNDMGISNTNSSHDVIVVGINKRSKNAKVKTITSLEKSNVFDNTKLKYVADGTITVIPNKDLGTRHLSGVYNKVNTIKINKLYTSTTGTKFPHRYKNIVGRYKKSDIVK